MRILHLKITAIFWSHHVHCNYKNNVRLWRLGFWQAHLIASDSVRHGDVVQSSAQISHTKLCIKENDFNGFSSAVFRQKLLEPGQMKCQLKLYVWVVWCQPAKLQNFSKTNWQAKMADIVNTKDPPNNFFFCKML